MATTTTTTGSKKRTIDPDTLNESTSAKKQRLDPDIPKKERVLKFIIVAFKALHKLIMKEQDQGYLSISVGVQVMNILFTGYSIKRQEAQIITSSMSTKANKTSPKVRYNGSDNPTTWDHIFAKIIEAANEVGLKFEKYEDDEDGRKNNWYGTACPYFNLLTGFSLRWKELRLGHSEMVFRKVGDRTDMVEVSKLGLGRAHHILLEGIRFPPERRSSMIQSMGPMTILICYLKSIQQYEKKFLAAAVRALAHIPNIETILTTIKGKNYAIIAPVINLIADISIIITTRQATKAFPPPNIFVKLCDGELIASSTLTGNYMDTGETSTGVIPEAISKLTNGQKMRLVLDFSGAGAFLLYKTACESKWTIGTKLTPELAAQAILHCWFGTFKEDMGVLSSITNNNRWMTREEMKDGFKTPNSEGNVKTVTLIQMTKYSKLSSASQTGELAQAYKQTASIPCFSGKRQRMFKEDFFKFMSGAKHSADNVMTTIPGIIAELTAIRTRLVEKLEKDGCRQDAGVTDWFGTDALSLDNLLKRPNWKPDKLNFRADETGAYFLG